MAVFMDQWVRTGGHARFSLTANFNRKRNTIELEIRQDNVNQKGVRKYVGPLLVQLQELDGTFKHTLQIENTLVKADITLHSKSRRNKKKKIPLCTGEEVDMDLSPMDESPVLWIRLDPEMTLLRVVNVEQPDFQWQFQLRHERDVTAQLEAIKALEKYPTPATRMALTDTIENENIFYKVRCKAALCLTQVANAMVTNWQGPPAMMAIFRKFFGSFSAPHIIRQNNFINFQHYFLQKTIPVAMAGLRTVHQICPEEVVKFLLSLFKYNDNSKNHYSDNYYRAALVDALGHSITPVISVVQQGNTITAENLSADAKDVLEEVTRLLNLEKHLPSYKYSVSVSCLKVIRKLQKCGHLPPNPKIYRSYAAYGQYIDLRIAAMECLVDFVKVDGRWDDLEHLMDLLETDPDPMARHALARLLIENPPFERGQKHRLDKEELVQRIWTNMNSLLSYDSRLRCDMVDLYYALYGTKTPFCLPNAELAALFKVPKLNPGGDAEIKRNRSRPTTPSFSDFKPIDFVAAETTPFGETKPIAQIITAPEIADIEDVKTTSSIVVDIDEDIIKFETINEEECEERVTTSDQITEISVKSEEVIKVEEVIDVTPQPPPSKKPKTEYYSDNSVSLPGITSEHAGPIGFSPGMFGLSSSTSTSVTNVQKSDATGSAGTGTDEGKKKDDSKPKKKKKDKKKHKHKHKHKRNKEKDRERSLEKKDPNIVRILKEEAHETLSSADSSSNSPSHTMDLSMNL